MAAGVGPGAAFGRIRYWGENASPTAAQPNDEMDVGPYQQQLDEERALGLCELVRALALSVEDLPPEFAEIQEWARGERDGRDLSTERRMLLWLPWDQTD